MKIIISIVAVMFYAVISCFISEMVDEEYELLCILLWPIVIACFIPIWIVSGIFKGIGWLSRKLRKYKGTYAHTDDSSYDQLLKAKEAIERTRNIKFKDVAEYVTTHNNEHHEGIEKIKGIANLEDKITKPFYELLAGTEDDLKVAEYMLDKERRALLITMMNTVGRLSPDVECLVEEWVANKKALDERKVALNREKGADKDE